MRSIRRNAAASRGDGPKRQWGSDKRSPLPILAAPASESTMLIGQLAIMVTVVGWLVFVVLTLTRSSITGAPGRPALDLATIGYLVIMSLLACSALAYLITRLGYYSRTRSHRRATRAELSQPFERSAPSLTVLIPSYQEDERVIRMTVLSAALQEYPDLGVVLLIDDPPEPKYAKPATMLAAAKRLPGDIEALLAVPMGRFERALADWDEHFKTAGKPVVDDVSIVASHYEFAATWMATYASDYEVVDHADRFLVEQVLRGLAADLTTNAQALRAAVADRAELTHNHLRYLLQRLTWIFGAKVTSFQRKRFVSLSHEPNKAMNLNSYIGLMGGSYREVDVPGGGRALLRTDGVPDLEVPNPDYVLTLDADSLLLPEYCLRIVHLLQQAEHERVAVAQAPYTSFPGAATRLERIAGATTDLQYMVHQGMTHYDATFWVGANAVLRKRAIDDLREVSHDGDWEISRYISDRTVIEDTESSIDLGVHGWRLLNYPERLSYSATPPDFGSLTIQRQRWANGGLLILPRLWRQIRVRRQRGERQRFGETFLRVNYMASIAWSSIALIFLLGYQFNDKLISPVVLLISIPYFAMMAVDLRHCGYRRRDVLGIYGFNLILLPVNLAGAGASMVQLLIGGRPAFKRTPKVRSRTTPGFTFVVMPYVFVAFSVVVLISDVSRDRWVNAALAVINATLAGYAIVAYIGVGNSIVDIFNNVVSWLYKPQRAPRAKRAAPRAAVPITVADAPAAHWSQTLAYASADGVRRAERRRSSHRDGVPGDRRSPLGDRRATVRAPEGHDRQDTIAAHMPAPESRDQRCSDQIGPAVLPDPPEPQLSPVRVMLAMLVIVAVGAGAFFAFRDVAETRVAQADAASRSATWFAPYVDATLTPSVAFQDRATNPARDVVLGFIVAGKTADATCTPTWGTYETLDGAASTMDLDRRVAQTRGQGGDAIISFGGQANTELAIACDDAGRLESAYTSVVERYTADTIDFDIEGEALHDTAANARRAKAVKALQDDMRAGGGHLAVWLTLPVTPDGLNPDALAVVRTMIDAKVDVAGVNVMAMDFGVPSAGKDMLGAVESSLTSTHAQLGALFGTDKTSSQLWGKLGATVMIGQNDVDGESLGVSDARTIKGFASSRGIARVSTWSLNRDTQCGATFPVIGTHSNLCSGVAQKPLEFTKTFAKLRGTARAKSAIVTAPTALPAATSETKDDPARSPYPIWQPLQPYGAGYKVVWHQAVYTAKWYTQGDSPDAQNVAAGDNPWRLVGPVLSTDRAPEIPTLPAGTHPKWTGATVFRSGDKVLYQGLPYQASWYTQGDVPGGTGPNGTPSPWKALYRIPGEPTDG